ncbi:MAG: response regulator transcription factor [Firmicutes bacterium]|nr:response regulator transcription factor [Bacillota bacterium]
MARILLVDDEPSFARGLRSQLEQAGHEVCLAYDGVEGCRQATGGKFDLILLDLMLPLMDGMEVCRRVRASSLIPIIMLTARDDDIDKILGLEVGADDYLTKPFNFRELLARIRALLRRVKFEGESRPRGRVLIDRRLIFDPETMRLFDEAGGGDTGGLQGGHEIPLTVKEAALLNLMAGYPGRIFSREELLERVWGMDYYGSLRTVDVHISRLRSKLELDPAVPRIFLTRWGQGYFLDQRALEAMEG